MAEDPLNADAMNSLSYMLAEHGVRLPEAVDLAERAVKIEPGNPAYLDTLGWALFKQGRAEEAAEPLAKAAAVLTGNSVIQDHHGDVLAKRGRNADAVAAWQRALAGDGESDRSRRHREEDQGREGQKQSNEEQITNEQTDQDTCVSPVCSLLLCSLSFGMRARTPPRPVGTPTPDPTAADAFATATAACKGFRSIEGELSLSGRAGGERVRGRILTGLESGGAVRLEAVAPFGAPFFILAGRSERATLVLPREHRVLKDTAVADVLERITGLALGADDLRLIVSGCLVEQAPRRLTAGSGAAAGSAVTIGPERVAYLRMQNGQPVLTAADYGPWHVDYSGARQRLPARGPRRAAPATARPSTSPRASSSSK